MTSKFKKKNKKYLKSNFGRENNFEIVNKNLLFSVKITNLN